MPNKIILGMDSSNSPFLACVSNGEKIYSSHRSGMKQEQFFLSVIEKTLAKAGASLADIQQVFFVRGPGRFTGIRISLTFASMLHFLNGAKVSSATLFEILHHQVRGAAAFKKWKKQNPQGVVAVVLHAFREEYFVQFFGDTDKEPQWLDKAQLLTVLAARREPLYVVGTDKNATPLGSLLGNKYQLAPMANCQVRPQTLIEMAANPIYEKNALEPLYLKPARFELGQ